MSDAPALHPLAAFLLARFKEEWAEAPDLHALQCEVWHEQPDGDPGACSCGAGPNEMAAIRARRAILDLHYERPRVLRTKRGDVVLANNYCQTCAWAVGRLDDEHDPFPCDTIKALALPYADHPDYREEWRP